MTFQILIVEDRAGAWVGRAKICNVTGDGLRILPAVRVKLFGGNFHLPRLFGDVLQTMAVRLTAFLPGKS